MVQFQGRAARKTDFLGLRWIGSFLITANNEFRGSRSHPYLEAQFVGDTGFGGIAK